MSVYRFSIHPLALLLAVGLLVFLLIFGNIASAKSLSLANDPTIEISNPAAIITVVGEGDDFARSVLRDPWDMDKRWDMGYDIGFNAVTASGGVWQATFSGVDQANGSASTGYFFPLFQGFSDLVTTGTGTYRSQTLNWNLNGAQDRFAIDTSKYTLLSFRMYTSNRTQYYVQWTYDKPVWWPDTTYQFGANDGCYTGNSFIPWPPGWRTYLFDLTQPNGDDGVRSGAWQDQQWVRGFSIHPSETGPVGTQIQVDWIRLTDRTSSPIVPIEWNVVGAAAEDVVDIYVADNPNGIGADTPLVRGIPALDGRYDLPASILEPGEYYFMVRLMAWGGGLYKGCSADAVLASSQWVGPLTVRGLPAITFTAPGRLSGEDYATTVLGNAWDMVDESDVITPGPSTGYPQTVADESFVDGIYGARAVIQAGATESDAQFWLNVDPAQPIDTTKYRYFTVKMRVDAPSDKDINWLVANGWGSRVIWWNTDIQVDGSETKFGYLMDGWQMYSVDLHRAIPPPPITDPAQTDNILTPKEQNSYPANLGWKQLGTMSHLRFDPMETTQAALGTGADWFYIDWVKLTAIDRVQAGQIYTIRLVADPGLDGVSLSFFYTTDPGGNPKQNPISLYSPPPLPPGAAPQAFLPLVGHNAAAMVEGTTYQWDTSGVAPGQYHLCVEASDGVNQAIYCSETPLEVY